MLENLVKKEGVLDNLIGLFNLIENGIKALLQELDVSQLEFSILMHISSTTATQYKMSKKYNISIQRAHQIIKKLIKKEYIIAEEGIINGRAYKKLTIKPEVEIKINEVNNQIVSTLKSRKVKYSNLKEFNNLLKMFLNTLGK
ncbi:MAG: MarR family transcriptional regulator [Fusobacteriaceae bacterium]